MMRSRSSGLLPITTSGTLQRYDSVGFRMHKKRNSAAAVQRLLTYLGLALLLGGSIYAVTRVGNLRGGMAGGADQFVVVTDELLDSARFGSDTNAGGAAHLDDLARGQHHLTAVHSGGSAAAGSAGAGQHHPVQGLHDLHDHMHDAHAVHEHDRRSAIEQQQGAGSIHGGGGDADLQQQQQQPVVGADALLQQQQEREQQHLEQQHIAELQLAAQHAQEAAHHAHHAAAQQQLAEQQQRQQHAGDAGAAAAGQQQQQHADAAAQQQQQQQQHSQHPHGHVAVSDVVAAHIAEQQAMPKREGPSLYTANLSAVDINGNVLHTADLDGKVTIIVNVASQCGFTDANYKGLQRLYSRYHDYGLEILAFPCNQFGQQEPSSHAVIEQFTKARYGVTFTMMSKTEVNGGSQHPLWAWLKEHTPAEGDYHQGEDVRWNFEKFLVDKHGHPVKRYTSDLVYHDIELDVYNELIKYLED